MNPLFLREEELRGAMHGPRAPAPAPGEASAAEGNGERAP